MAEATDAVYLNSRQVRDRYGGVSEMWIERRLKDSASKFPQPTLIVGRRRFWTAVSLIAWERSQAGQSRTASADRMESQHETYATARDHFGNRTEPDRRPT